MARVTSIQLVTSEQRKIGCKLAQTEPPSAAPRCDSHGGDLLYNRVHVLLLSYLPLLPGLLYNLVHVLLLIDLLYNLVHVLLLTDLLYKLVHVLLLSDLLCDISAERHCVLPRAAIDSVVPVARVDEVVATAELNHVVSGTTANADTVRAVGHRDDVIAARRVHHLHLRSENVNDEARVTLLVLDNDRIKSFTAVDHLQTYHHKRTSHSQSQSNKTKSSHSQSQRKKTKQRTALTASLRANQQ